MIEHIIQMHRFTHNIPPPSTPKRYDPNKPPFDPSEFLGGVELDKDDLDDDEE